MSPDELCTSAQIAEWLGVSEQHVDQLVESGQLPQPVGRSGGTRVWRAADIEPVLAGSDPSTGRPPTPGWGTVAVPVTALGLAAVLFAVASVVSALLPQESGDRRNLWRDWMRHRERMARLRHTTKDHPQQSD
ncbi:helix-turn-helix transcriptional regulator [Streptomyces sp. NPDC058424]|uniref:helix-turn-helix transcriptional regulator n=1 Tax=Streptomyces sp. NPDC058424 TaxID=3346491 RepID=UPI003656904F